MAKQSTLDYLNDKYTAIIVIKHGAVGVENFYCDITEIPHYIEKIEDGGATIEDIVIRDAKTGRPI